MAGDLTSIPQPAASALRIRQLPSTAYWEPLRPPGESFPRTVLVPHHTRHVPTAPEHRNPPKVKTASGRRLKLLVSSGRFTSNLT